jgi:hypothetical protein
MLGLRISDPSWLRERAVHCRDLANRTESTITASELLILAVEYDADAANIETDNAAAVASDRRVAAPSSEGRSD